MWALQNNPIDKKYLYKIEIPTASIKIFPSRMKTDGQTLHAWQNIQLILNICSSWKFQLSWAKHPNTKDKIKCKPCMRSKTIQLIKNIWTISTFQLPQAKFFHHETKQTVQAMCDSQNNPNDQEYLDKLKISTASRSKCPS